MQDSVLASFRDRVRNFPVSANFRASESWRKLVRRTEGRADPIGVGGVGGSGTRLVSDLLEHMGLDAGVVLSGTRDSLVWPRFGLVYETAATEPDMVARSFESVERFARQREQRLAVREEAWHWFWKVPTTFMWLDYFVEYFQELRYVHVVRHGLDMAFSKNENQVQKWGFALGVEATGKLSPIDMLDYWIAANRYTAMKTAELLGERVLWLSYDALCLEPERTIEKLLAFVGLSPGRADLPALVARVRPSSGLGRYRKRDCEALFGSERLEAVQAFGFPID